MMRHFLTDFAPWEKRDRVMQPPIISEQVQAVRDVSEFFLKRQPSLSELIVACFSWLCGLVWRSRVLLSLSAPTLNTEIAGNFS